MTSKKIMKFHITQFIDDVNTHALAIKQSKVHSKVKIRLNTTTPPKSLIQANNCFTNNKTESNITWYFIRLKLFSYPNNDFEMPIFRAQTLLPLHATLSSLHVIKRGSLIKLRLDMKHQY